MNSPERRETGTVAPSASGAAAAIPYVLPFAVFVGFLALSPYLEPLGRWEYPLRALILALVLAVFSHRVIDLRVRNFGLTAVLGVGVFALWIAPDLLIPGYRNHWLFQNSITGEVRQALPEHLRGDVLTLLFRALRAVVLVPVIEELFWRAWLMRWLISPKFESVPLGAFTAGSFGITAILFASEHGPFWDVGLIAGLIYNWLMVRTRSLGNCIWAHAVTNGCLSAYVIASGRWEYWP